MYRLSMRILIRGVAVVVVGQGRGGEGVRGGVMKEGSCIFAVLCLPYLQAV